MVRDTNAEVRKVLWLILFINITVAVLKVVIGKVAGSCGMVADGYHSTGDAAVNVIALIGMKLAAKPPDTGHPYGHGKYEMVTGLIIGIVLVFLGLNTVTEGIKRMISPVVPQITFTGFLVLISTIIINITVAVYEYRKGLKLNSKILKYDAMHTRSNIFISLGVLVSLILFWTGFPPHIDAFASLAVSLFIFHAAYGMIIENTRILSDGCLYNEDLLRGIIRQFNGIDKVSLIKSRGVPGDAYIEMQVEMEAGMTIAETDLIADDIKSYFGRKLGQKVHLSVSFKPVSGYKPGR